MPSKVVYKPVGKIKPIYAGGTITPPKFMPTYYEWLFRHAEAIFIDSDASGLLGISKTIYTVPPGYKLYETALTFVTQYFPGGASSGYTQVTGQRGGKAKRLMYVYLIKDTTLATNLTMSYPFPVVFDSGVIHHGAQNVYSNISLHGFLVKISDIPVF